MTEGSSEKPLDSESLTVSFDLVRKDLRRAARDRTLEQKTTRFLAAVVALSSIVAVTLVFTGYEGDMIRVLLNCLTLPLLSLVLTIVVFPAMSAPKDPRFLGRQVYHFSEAGIELETSFTKANFTWSSYAKVVECRSDYLMFMTGRVFGALPKRAFSSGNDEEKFRRLVLKHVADNKLKPKKVSEA